MNRIEVLWRPVTNHLLEVSSHPLNRMREWGVEAITTLVRSAVQYQHLNPLKENQVPFFIIVKNRVLHSNIIIIIFLYLEVADIVNIAFKRTFE